MNKAEINEIENRNNRKLIKRKTLGGRKVVLLALNHILLDTGLKSSIMSGPHGSPRPIFHSSEV